MAKLESFDRLVCRGCGSETFLVAGDMQGLRATCAKCGAEVLLGPQMHLAYWDVVRHAAKRAQQKKADTV